MGSARFSGSKVACSCRVAKDCIVSRLHDLNFLIKLGGAFAVALVAWLARDPIAALIITGLVILGLKAAQVPNLRGYLKGSALLASMVMVMWSINMSLQ